MLFYLFHRKWQSKREHAQQCRKAFYQFCNALTFGQDNFKQDKADFGGDGGNNCYHRRFFIQNLFKRNIGGNGFNIKYDKCEH
ncbi:MAG: hypothetical protein MJ132_06175, partial [Clostridia bacterium]|nr:hypothetical protein [Clostridia bacterium]